MYTGSLSIRKINTFMVGRTSHIAVIHTVLLNKKDYLNKFTFRLICYPFRIFFYFFASQLSVFGPLRSPQTFVRRGADQKPLVSEDDTSLAW